MSEQHGNQSEERGLQVAGPPREGAAPHPQAELYEEYEYEYNISFEGLSANKYAIVIGFWIGLAAVVVFLFSALALMVNMNGKSASRGGPAEELNRVRRAWRRDSCSPARLIVDEGVPDPDPGRPPAGRGWVGVAWSSGRAPPKVYSQCLLPLVGGPPAPPPPDGGPLRADGVPCTGDRPPPPMFPPGRPQLDPDS